MTIVNRLSLALLSKERLKKQDWILPLNIVENDNRPVGFYLYNTLQQCFRCKIKKGWTFMSFFMYIIYFHFKDLSVFRFKVAVKHLQRSPYLKLFMLKIFWKYSVCTFSYLVNLLILRTFLKKLADQAEHLLKGNFEGFSRQSTSSLSQGSVLHRSSSWNLILRFGLNSNYF